MQPFGLGGVMRKQGSTLQSGLEDLGADGLLLPPVPSPPGRGETARFALTGQYSPTTPSTSYDMHFLTYKGLAEGARSRFRATETSPAVAAVAFPARRRPARPQSHPTSLPIDRTRSRTSP